MFRFSIKSGSRAVTTSLHKVCRSSGGADRPSVALGAGHKRRKDDDMRVNLIYTLWGETGSDSIYIV